MIHEPKTLAEAQAHRYGRRGLTRLGDAYDPDCCAASVRGASGRWHQCYRKPGNGPAGLYCKTHAKKVKP